MSKGSDCARMKFDVTSCFGDLTIDKHTPSMNSTNNLPWDVDGARPVCVRCDVMAFWDFWVKDVTPRTRLPCQ